MSERPGSPQEPEDPARVQALPAVGEIGPAPEILTGDPAARGALARNTAIFSIATGLSRIAGLAREVAAAG